MMESFYGLRNKENDARFFPSLSEPIINNLYFMFELEDRVTLCFDYSGSYIVQNQPGSY